MNTFNNKQQWKNVLAIILAIVGIVLLFLAWGYHMIVHLITIPREKWIDIRDKSIWIKREDYPNKFCQCFCNIEASMIHQLFLLREGFGKEYCNEEKI